MAFDIKAASETSPEERIQNSVRAFWEVLVPARQRITEAVTRALMEHPELMQVIRSIPAAQQAEDQAASERAQEQAMVHGNWKPLIEHLTRSGIQYAERGVSFGAWFDLVSMFRVQMREILVETSHANLPLALAAGEGLNYFFDFNLRYIGEAYLTAKQTLISRQQEAIRELSTPVLQVRDRLLIIPVVGMVDTLRARHLTEALLRAIREQRARAVVMDITGVPIVDSRVANHLVQACEAARLMGAHVIITGVSSSIAQALVTIGADLRGVPTLGDLQTGLEAAEALLAANFGQTPAAPNTARQDATLTPAA